MKRSNAPIFWLLFGAGGMLSALLGTALVLVTGLLAPLGWVLGPAWMDYPRALAFAPDGTLLVAEAGRGEVRRFAIERSAAPAARE